jgi:hypothetical protein
MCNCFGLCIPNIGCPVLLLDLWVAGAHSPCGQPHDCTRSKGVSCARLRCSRCLVQVTFKAAYKKLEGKPRLQGIRQLAALSAEGWVPPVRCRCCHSACYSQARAGYQCPTSARSRPYAKHKAHQGPAHGQSMVLRLTHTERLLTNAAEWVSAGRLPSELRHLC